MESFLQKNGYLRDAQTGVWAEPGFAGIAYSDGDGVEQRLAEVVAQADDLSVLSDELKPHMVDWPSLYHLSSSRSNLMRPFAHRLAGADVLEIGAGCGAITRYLGESGARVLALEGSLRRAAIARSRTRDLPQVDVLAQRFDQFQCDSQFDVVTLIGVLEYANQFVPGPTPALTMLQRARAALRQGGVLLLAIENQLGLKYWAGAAEDHLGIPMYGLEGRYRADQPQTYGRRALQALLAAAGFARSEVLSPLPDYKLPASIIAPAGFASPDFDAAALAWQSVRRDPQLPPNPLFAPELVWPVVMENGLGTDLANSFLVIAGEDVPLLDRTVLALHYTTGRASAFCKETLFRQSPHEGVQVHCALLDATAPRASAGRLVFRLAAQSPYVRGVPMSRQLMQLVMRDGWSIDSLSDFLKHYVAVVTQLAGVEPSLLLPASLPGKCFDLLPQNIVCDAEGRHHAIDMEWQLVEDIPIGWLLFRVLLLLVHGVTRFGDCATPFERTRYGLFETALRGAGLQVDAESIATFAEMERAVQVEVTGQSPELLAGWCSDAPVSIGPPSGRPPALAAEVQQSEQRDLQVVAPDDLQGQGCAQLHGRNQDVAGLQQSLEEMRVNHAQVVDEYSRQAAGLHETLHDIQASAQLAMQARDQQIAFLRTSLQTVQSSWSWKLTGPLRRAAAWISGVDGSGQPHPANAETPNTGARVRPLSGVARLAASWRRLSREWAALAKAFRGTFAFHGSARVIAGVAIRVLRTEGWRGLHQRTRIFWRDMTARRGRPRPFSEDDTLRLYGAVPPKRVDFQPKVSIVVPNYNHESYLDRRLASIYEQTYRNIEVILLDDCSSDNSLEVMERYRAKYPDITRLERNERNSGGAFHQWKKGIALAQGDLLWIAESDDYCDPHFLEELIPFFENPGVALAFCRSDFVDAEASNKVWTSEEYLSDLGLRLWTSPFIRSAHSLVNHGWGVKNMLANASSALMRHPGGLAILDDPAWTSLRLCGDWIFYLHVIRGGLVGYTPATTNYYRQHGTGTSVATQKTDTYYREFAIVAKTLLETYRLKDDVLARQREALLQHWRMMQGEGADARFEALYDIDAIRQLAQPRKQNVLMAGFAFSVGGGETFPIFLANQLRLHGWGVTYFNCRVEETVTDVRAMLDRHIPLIEIDEMQQIDLVCQDMGIEVVHSHHAWVDLTLASCIHTEPRPRQIITMHGMYEMIEADRMVGVLRLMEQRVDAIVYTAEKNTAPFSADFQARKRFKRINNALGPVPICPVSREELGIEAGDFVLCLISRALPEKGWQEAVDAVELAAKSGQRQIHLLLIGEGVEYDRLAGPRATPNIHFLGFRKNLRDYLAISDMGFLPTRFPGESFPLVLIDSLLSGKPVLASNKGEIAALVESPNGPAGWIFDLDQGAIPVPMLAQIIRKIADDHALYSTMLARVPSAAEKFDMARMAEQYESVYESVLRPH